MRVTRLLISKIVLDAGTQVRVEIDQDTVERYAALMADGAVFEPIDVFCDGDEYWPSDGFHRIHAALKCGKTIIPAYVHKGTFAQAMWAALAANSQHGKPMTTADKVKAIKMALRLHPEHSNPVLSRHVGVDDKTVAKYRAEMESTSEIPRLTTRIGADGKERPASSTARVVTRAQYEAGTADSDSVPNVDDIPMDLGGASPAAPPKDMEGNTLPAKLVKMFERRNELTEMMHLVSRLKSKVLAAVDSKDPLFTHFNANAFQADVTNLYRDFDFARPHGVCPYCKARGCQACAAQGWVTESTYKFAPPEYKLKNAE